MAVSNPYLRPALYQRGYLYTICRYDLDGDGVLTHEEWREAHRKELEVLVLSIAARG